MPTIWTKRSNIITSYTPNEGYGFLYDSLSIYDDPSRKYDGGFVNNYLKTGDIVSNYRFQGTRLYLATEDWDYLMEENGNTYLLVRDNGVYTKVGDISTSWTKVNDI